MSETLILLLGRTPDDPAGWAFIDAGAIVAADIAPDAYALSSVAVRAANARPVVAVLPGEDAAMRTLPSPPRVPSKFKAAAMYLLEDELAEGLDTLHVATARREDGAGAALAIKRSALDAWLDVFTQAGISPDIVTPDFALLSHARDSAVIVFERRRMICAVGHDGFAAERPLADVLAARLVADEDIQRIEALGDSHAERFDAAGKEIAWRGLADDVSLFRRYAEGAARGDAPNFLQGDYRKRRDWRGVVAPWRRAAALAAACLVGLVGVTIADGVRSIRIEDRLNDQALALHQAAFPDAANADPREHARRILSSKTAGPAFLPLAAEFADSLGENSNIQIDRIRFNAARSEFSVNLSFSGINDLEDLKRKLAAKGVDAKEAGGVRKSGGRYIGELQVSL